MMPSRRRFLSQSAAALGAAACAGLLGACSAPQSPSSGGAGAAAAPSPTGAPASAAATPTGAAATRYGPAWRLPEPARIAVIHSGALIQAPLFVARDEGLFERFNLEVALETGAPADVGPLMARGEIKAVALGLSAATLNLIDRAPSAYAFIAGNSVVPPSGLASVGVVARKDLYDAREIASVADLRGRRLGVAALWDGTTYGTATVLREGGLGLSDVERVELGSYQNIVVALQGGSIDAAAVFDPLLTNAVNQGVGVILSRQAAPGLLETFFWANREWATGARDEATAFLAAVLLAQRELNRRGFTEPAIAAIVEK